MAKETNHPRAEGDDHPNHFLREWREYMGWSQEELGEMAHVHYSKIGRIENGKRELKASFLQQLARIFGVPASALLEVNPATEEGAQTAEMLLAWKELPKDKRIDVLTIMRALTGRTKKNDAS